jgi:Tfp pilus assembly protein PilO
MKNILPVILIAVAVTLYFTEIQSQIENVQQTRMTNKSYLEAINQTEQITDLRQKLVAKVSSFDQSDLDKLKKSIPEKFNNVTFTNDLNGIAMRNGFSISDISVDSNSSQSSSADRSLGNSKPYIEHNVTFHFKTSYENVNKFVNDLEQSLRLIDISSINISPTDKGDYNFSFKIKTYSLK